ncbi:hypothetical protein LSAT2_003274 [Lamellibrachia satsuma]|nr:hypothetical protein LSAT2_003274 [Lamellibrachia satsuma]
MYSSLRLCDRIEQLHTTIPRNSCLNPSRRQSIAAKNNSSRSAKKQTGSETIQDVTQEIPHAWRNDRLESAALRCRVNDTITMHHIFHRRCC